VSPAANNVSKSPYANHRWDVALYDSPTVPRWLRDKGGALLHLAELKTGKFVASYATLAEKWGVGRRQAIRIAQRLHKEHALKFEHRFAKPHPKAKPRPKNQTCNAWELTVPKSWLTEPGRRAVTRRRRDELAELGATDGERTRRAVDVITPCAFNAA